MVLQDKVYVEHYNYLNPENIISSKEFRFSESDKDYDNFLEIKENESWRLVFIGSYDDKLYIDGLNLIEDKNIKLDEDDQQYISPGINNQIIINLYEPSSNSDEDTSGFLPGNFLLRLLTYDDESYSWLKVKPKFVNNNELKTIRKEIDELVEELSLDHHRAGYFGSHYLDYKYLTIDDLETLAILHSNKNKFLSNYQELIDDPKMKIDSSYVWTNNEISLIDQISIKEMTKHPEKRNLVYRKKRTTSSNLEENIDLKKNLEFLRDRISELIYRVNCELEFKSYLKYSKENPLEGDQRIAILYLNLINNVLNKDWVTNISTDYSISENELTSDRRYLFFKKLVWKIQHSSYHKPEFHRQYGYYWKRTELLYEIWGYLKVIKSMQNIGFKTQSGWIFNIAAEEILPPLEEGTTVNMVYNKKGYEKLYAKVIYNKVIKAKSQNQVEANDPIWCTSNHNKPDIRINIYDKDETLVYVIVLDSKYRKLASCISGVTWDQINSYSSCLYSEYPYKNRRYNYLEKARIELKSIDSTTYILYPKQENEIMHKVIADRLADGRIKAIGLKPKIRALNLENELINCINKVENWIINKG